MRHPTSVVAGLVVLALAVAAAGCNKGPAESALQAARQALDAASPELEKYAPDELASFTTVIKEARALFDKGSYTAALKAVQPLPSRIQQALARARERKEMLSATWTQVSSEVPGLIAVLSTRLAELGAGGRLPKGMDRDGVSTAKNDLSTISEAWRVAADAFQGGDIPRAVRMAQDVKAKAERLAAAIGVDVPAVAPKSAAPVM
jgi:hypothetical protein